MTHGPVDGCINVTDFVKTYPAKEIYSVSRRRWGFAVAQLVEVLCYNPERHRLDSRWCNWNFSLN